MNDLERILNLAGVKYETPVTEEKKVDRVLKEGIINETCTLKCKECGDMLGEPTTDCAYDSQDPKGENWVMIDIDGDGDADYAVANEGFAVGARVAPEEEGPDQAPGKVIAVNGDKVTVEFMDGSTEVFAQNELFALPEGIEEDEVEEGSIKYMHSLKNDGKSDEEIAKELSMSPEEIKKAMNTTNEAKEDDFSKDNLKVCDKCDEEEKDCKCDDEDTIKESPTMDTTQLIHLLKLSGISEEKINEHISKVEEAFANTPDGVGETEPTQHGTEDNYNFAQMVNLSLKRYLDAQDMKVSVNESHTIEGMKAKYEEMKNK